MEPSILMFVIFIVFTNSCVVGTEMKLKKE